MKRVTPRHADSYHLQHLTSWSRGKGKFRLIRGPSAILWIHRHHTEYGTARPQTGFRRQSDTGWICMLQAQLLVLKEITLLKSLTRSPFRRPQTSPSRFTVTLLLWLPQEVHKTFTTQFLHHSHKFQLCFTSDSTNWAPTAKPCRSCCCTAGSIHTPGVAQSQYRSPGLQERFASLSAKKSEFLPLRCSPR